MRVLYLAVFGLICGKDALQCGIFRTFTMLIEFAAQLVFNLAA